MVQIQFPRGYIISNYEKETDFEKLLAMTLYKLTSS